jgi:hypothetical protein
MSSKSRSQSRSQSRTLNSKPKLKKYIIKKASRKKDADTDTDKDVNLEKSDNKSNTLSPIQKLITGATLAASALGIGYALSSKSDKSEVEVKYNPDKYIQDRTLLSLPKPAISYTIFLNAFNGLFCNAFNEYIINEFISKRLTFDDIMCDKMEDNKFIKELSLIATQKYNDFADKFFNLSDKCKAFPVALLRKKTYKIEGDETESVTRNIPFISTIQKSFDGLSEISQTLDKYKLVVAGALTPTLPDMGHHTKPNPNDTVFHMFSNYVMSAEESVLIDKNKDKIQQLYGKDGKSNTTTYSFPLITLLPKLAYLFERQSICFLYDFFAIITSRQYLYDEKGNPKPDSAISVESLDKQIQKDFVQMGMLVSEKLTRPNTILFKIYERIITELFQQKKAEDALMNNLPKEIAEPTRAMIIKLIANYYINMQPIIWIPIIQSIFNDLIVRPPKKWFMTNIEIKEAELADLHKRLARLDKKLEYNIQRLANELFKLDATKSNDDNSNLKNQTIPLIVRLIKEHIANPSAKLDSANYPNIHLVGEIIKDLLDNAFLLEYITGFNKERQDTRQEIQKLADKLAQLKLKPIKVEISIDVLDFIAEKFIMNSGPFILKIFQIAMLVSPVPILKNKLKYPAMIEKHSQIILRDILVDPSLWEMLWTNSASVGQVYCLRHRETKHEVIVKIIKFLSMIQLCAEKKLLLDVASNTRTANSLLPCERDYVESILDSNQSEFNVKKNEKELISNASKWYSASYSDLFTTDELRGVNAFVSTIRLEPNILKDNNTTWFAVAMSKAGGFTLEDVLHAGIDFTKPTRFVSLLHRALDILVYKFMDSILQFGRFHADLHPGNIFIRYFIKDGKYGVEITLIDFGSVGTIVYDGIRDNTNSVHWLYNGIINIANNNFEDALTDFKKFFILYKDSCSPKAKAKSSTDVTKAIDEFFNDSKLNEQIQTKFKSVQLLYKKIGSRLKELTGGIKKAILATIFEEKKYSVPVSSAAPAIQDIPIISLTDILAEPEDADKYPCQPDTEEIFPTPSLADVIVEIIKYFNAYNVNVLIKIPNHKPNLNDLIRGFILFTGSLKKMGYSSVRITVIIKYLIEQKYPSSGISKLVTAFRLNNLFAASELADMQKVAEEKWKTFCAAS